MRHQSVKPVRRLVLAVLLSAALFSALAGPDTAHAEPCADSPAATRAGTLYAEGESLAALPFARDALKRAEEICGPRNIAVVVLLADLAAIYQDLERYGEAENFLRRVIEIKQAARPPEQENKPRAALPNMVIDLNNLAFVYGAQGKFEEAGKLFERLLAIVEHAVGGEHIIVSHALKNLAENKRARGRYGDARPLLARAAQIEAMTDDDIPPDWAAKLGLSSPPSSAIGDHSEAEALLRLLESAPE